MEFWSVVVRLFLVFICAGLFGLNRQRAHKPVGFGTFIFVAVGSSALAISSVELAGENPLPLLSAIVTGIGFLGAGAMIKTSDKIFGVTTAASIWLFSIFGLLIGVGQFLLGLMLYGLVWVVLFIDNILEHKGIVSYQRKFTIVSGQTMSENNLHALLLKTCRRHKLLEMHVDMKDANITRQYLIEGSYATISRLPHYLEKERGFLRCSIQ